MTIPVYHGGLAIPEDTLVFYGNSQCEVWVKQLLVMMTPIG